MFKFEFSTEDGIDELKETTEVKHDVITWKESREILLEDVKNLEEIITNCSTNCIKFETIDIKCISSVDAVLDLIRNENNEQQCSILEAEKTNSDLLSGIYEGGLKIWECTYDILNYLRGNSTIDLCDKKVLDLGCGSGIIGTLCLKKNATCYFQDYNEEVIKTITIPNQVINSENLQKCRFFSGDWSSFSYLLQREFSEETNKFDYIVTSETIYNTSNYQKLHDVFQRLLKLDGTVFLAAKAYYFGVGGGMAEFKDCLLERNVFKFDSVWKTTTGLEREILEIKFNK